MRHEELNKARAGKKDEFYTTREMVEAELKHYPDAFRGKAVYCNCDSEESAFWKVFRDGFWAMGLKSLTATHWAPGAETSVCSTYDGWQVVRREIPGDGDFRSDACRELLGEADVVVTNPPFSLFREYVGTLVQSGVDFLVVGNLNAVSYREIFPLVQSGVIRLGVSIHSGDRLFYVADDYDLKAAGCGVDEQGRRYIRVKGVRWFTNMAPIDGRGELELTCLYRGHEDEYPRYDNCDAIEVNRTARIPGDYDGLMGVPISFMDRYCPEQFELVRFRYGDDGRDLVYTKDGQRVYPYFRILIRRRWF